ncbi:G5 domain-containing protein [Ligilactobacillus animalis]|uniref:G5 domain-containing protein n=1 Tax=Ligilactobacillus animalis TaxID=1605 RepID=UPI0026489B9F|nr:G5 domain-containing protein [Ligilactobacillus animalis]WKB73081.1 G5 domain-containing protein [Ligilactobacillus animalis]
MAKSNRSKWQMGEQKQRFAIRKFSQGVFSVLVGTMFVFGTPAVIQGDEIAGTHIGTKKKEQYQIKFQHVTENSLTSEQRAKVIYDNPPKTKVGSDQVYYLVYRPVATQNLPQTGELEMPWELGLFGATALIMGLGVLPKRARKYRFLTAIIVASTVVGVGSSVASASPNFAELSSYDRACLVAEDENSPEISTQHAGYQYIGYILVSDIKHPGESVPTTRPVTEKVVPNSDKTPNTGSAAIEVTKPEIQEGSIPTVVEETKVEPVGYETQYVDDPELLEGTTNVRTPGQAGERTIVYEVTRDAEGKELNRVEKSNMITKAPVTEVIARGTKVEVPEEPKVTVSEEMKTEPVGYETQYVDDPELLEGTTSVQTAGQAGKRTIVYEVTRDAEGKELNRVEKSNTITKAPVTEVIARGTKVEVPEEPKVTVSEEMKTEPVGYETQYVDDPELLEGTTSVRTAGQAGERTIVYEVTRDATGKELSRVEKSNTITKAPVTEVVVRGTKPKTTVTEEVVLEEIPYTSEIQNDPELLKGTTSVRTAGQAGERTIVYEVTRDAEGKELSRVEKSNTITKAPVTEVVVRGTKPKTTVTEEVVLEEIPYTSELQNDPELFIGTTVVKTAGQAGERTIIYEVTRDAEGKELARVEKSSKITKAPVNEVVAQGTKLYAKPLVELTSADEAVDNKTATVSYTVTDPDKKLRAIKVSLYKDNEKVTEKLVDLATLTTTFADLAYNTNYRLETEYTYDIGQGDQTENLKPITVELTPKKVELKNFNNIGLYQLGANGGLELVSSLAELPTDPNKYVAKIVSAQQKDWYLPIASFEEVELGGKTKYQATIATPELVTYQADKRDFSAGHTFLIDKTEVSNEYTNFAELLKAIKADPTGDFILAADLDALGLADTDASYITETFSGTLRSKADNAYTIYNLNKPLFNVVKGATIDNITF